jgi:hypothetical protein
MKAKKKRKQARRAAVRRLLTVLYLYKGYKLEYRSVWGGIMAAIQDLRPKLHKRLIRKMDRLVDGYDAPGKILHKEYPT